MMNKRILIIKLIPYILFLLIFFTSATLWINITINKKQSVEINQNITTNNIGIEMHQNIINRINLISDVMVHNWVNVTYTNNTSVKNKFYSIVDHYFNYYPSIIALNYIDNNGTILYPYPKISSLVNQSIVYIANNRLNTAFAQANATNKITLTSIIPLYQGGYGIAIYIPLLKNNTRLGFFNLVIDLIKLTDNYFSKRLIGINKTINILFINNNFTYYIFNNNFSLTDSYVQHYSIIIYNQIIDMYTRPLTLEIYKASYMGNSYVMLIGLYSATVTFILTRYLIIKEQKLRANYEKQKKIDEVLWYYQKMDSLGSMAGKITHDFNNLLMSLQGNLDILDSELQYLNKNTDEYVFTELYSSITTMRDIIKRASDLTGKILAFSRSSIGNNENIIDVNKEIVSLINLFEPLAKPKVNVIFNENKDIIYTKMDIGQFSQILMNILMNSLDAMPEGGVISISVSLIDTENVIDYIHIKDDFDTENIIEIKITDTGIGIPKENIELVFDPYFTTKPRGHGTGLGLSIVYSTIKKIGGHVTIDSIEGEGTTITLYIPYYINTDSNEFHELIKKSINDTNHIVNDIPQLNLLIVDDELNIVDTLTRYLFNKGHNVVSYSLGLEALDFYNKNYDKIDIVILDLLLPDINGEELANEIIKMNNKQKIMFISGYSDTYLPKTENKNIRVLRKPFALKSLYAEIYSLFTEKIN